LAEPAGVITTSQLSETATAILSIDEFLPAVGQGIIAVESARRRCPSARADHPLNDTFAASAGLSPLEEIRAGRGRCHLARARRPEAAGVGAAVTASGERSFTAYSGRDMEGGDYHNQRGVSSDQCEKLCRRDSRCQAYSYDAWNHHCFLKAALGPLRLEPRTVTYVASGAAVSYDERGPVIQPRI
jgi:hypothetical protein